MFLSKNQRYLQFDETIVDCNTGLRFNINEAHPAFVCELFKDQFTHAHKTGLMENIDLFSKMKSLIYPLIQHDGHLVMEYEVRYGMRVLTESEGPSFTSIRLIEESWDFVKTKMLETLPLSKEELLEYWGEKYINKAVNYVKDTGKKIYNAGKKVVNAVIDSIASAAKWILNKGLPWFFNTLEKFLLSPVGIGLDVALTVIGVGKIASAVLWGSLGIWKLYEIFSGKTPLIGEFWNDFWIVLDVAICFIGLLFTGGAAKALKAGVQSVGRNMGKLAKLPGIKTLVNLINRGASFVANGLGKSMDWLSKTIGGKVGSVISTAKSNIVKFFEKLKNLVSQITNSSGSFRKGVQQDIINPAKAAMKDPKLLRTAAIKGTTAGLAFHGFDVAVHNASDAYIESETGMSAEEVASQTENMKTLEDVMKNRAPVVGPSDTTSTN